MIPNYWQDMQEKGIEVTLKLFEKNIELLILKTKQN